MACQIGNHDPANLVTMEWDNGQKVKVCTECSCTIEEPGGAVSTMSVMGSIMGSNVCTSATNQPNANVFLGAKVVKR